MRKADFYKFLFVALAGVIAIGISACSSQEVTHTRTAGDKNFSFYNTGDDSRYEVSFDKKNKITSLYKNGKEIPEAEYDNYEEIVYSKLNELTAGDEKRQHVYRFDIDRKVPHMELRELEDFGEWEVDSPNVKRRIFIHRDGDSTRNKKVYKFHGEFPHREFIHKMNDSSFKEEMGRMKEELTKLKDVKIKLNFDSDEFRKEMEIIRKEIGTNLNENLRNLNEEIKEITRELKNQKFDEIKEIEVDIPDIEIDLENLDRKMENLDKEMSKVKVELKKLDGFMKEIRKELYKDKIIDSEDEDFSLNLNASVMRVNDKEISSGLFPKYKKMYERHFGKELKGKEEFEIQN